MVTTASKWRAWYVNLNKMQTWCQKCEQINRKSLPRWNRMNVENTIRQCALYNLESLLDAVKLIIGTESLRIINWWGIYPTPKFLQHTWKFETKMNIFTVMNPFPRPTNSFTPLPVSSQFVNIGLYKPIFCKYRPSIRSSSTSHLWKTRHWVLTILLKPNYRVVDYWPVIGAK